jgi:glucose-1-phosphate cytidylyltransferase
MVARMQASDKVASLLAVPPQSAFHVLELGEDSDITEIRAVNTMPMWENGGYFVLRQGIFDVLPEGGDLVQDACGALARQGRLSAYRYTGFWQPADTVKERVVLENAYETGNAPWMVWSDERRGSAPDEAPPVVGTTHGR